MNDAKMGYALYTYYYTVSGPITMVMLLDVAPFQNTIDIIKINGSALWEIFGIVV
jgi:2',3'-cyclic-nucleotide 2'-phosphodiesterase (5'-nucleotidase family)